MTMRFMPIDWEQVGADLFALFGWLVVLVGVALAVLVAWYAVLTVIG